MSEFLRWQPAFPQRTARRLWTQGLNAFRPGGCLCSRITPLLRMSTTNYLPQVNEFDISLALGFDREKSYRQSSIWFELLMQSKEQMELRFHTASAPMKLAQHPTTNGFSNLLAPTNGLMNSVLQGINYLELVSSGRWQPAPWTVVIELDGLTCGVEAARWKRKAVEPRLKREQL
ncbi:hypothetical protein PAAG_00443 [Paracoccidioides lutzii Pb01]|uniref:Uncharacterized protein n=1 Tax=Paracoccidioides lutzii (strain ATCC MYA-826 / Pb01) TaxID=502779 RepID=C1GPJ8_PARBA|nr:hypothetical protein PAAG_00443 [Paracoccidioides lutzii Pb01]EEH36120.2 hypothetical protein PAAG_00443 [Paracoccidioides lutzii Pb01]